MKTVGMIAVSCVMLCFAPHQAKASSFCATGTAQEIMGSPNSADDLDYVYSHCREGDVIAIPGNTTSEIAEICDFTKTMITEPSGQIMCIIGKRKSSD